MHDGTEVHIEVTRPADANGRPVDGEWPVILEASPYHGTLADREGMRILPDPRDEDGTSLGLTGYFAPKGYAVVMMDLRGTGLSDGCLDHLGANDAKDLEQVVEWAAAQPWSNGRVGHDRPLLRRLDAVAGGRHEPGGPRDDRPERRHGDHVRPPVPGRRPLLPAVGRPDGGLRADRARADLPAASTSGRSPRRPAAACRTARDRRGGPALGAVHVVARGARLAGRRDAPPTSRSSWSTA